MVDWKENNRPVFSFGYLKGYLFKEANFDKSILSSFHFKKGDIGMIGTSGALGMFGTSASRMDLELKGIQLYEVAVSRKDHGESPAIYFCVQDRDKKGLEVLIVREDALKSFVRYMSELSDEERSQISLRLINLEGKNSNAERSGGVVWPIWRSLCGEQPPWLMPPHESAVVQNGMG